MNNNCVDFLEKTSKKYPEKIAIVENEKKITFKELKTNALKISIQLPPKIKNQPIVIFLPKGITAVECYLGVLYSGNFYVPVDIKSPEQRLRKIFKDLNPRAILTNNINIEKLKKTTNDSYAIINIDNQVLNENNKGEKNNTIDSDPIYCIYTSGSTGFPKGVLIPQKAVFDFIQWSEKTYDINSKTIIGNQSPFFFDVSIMDIYLCLKTGAELHIIPEFLFSFPVRLLEYLKQNNINHVIWVPSVLINIANSGALEKIKLPKLKQILFAGEVMPNKYLNTLRKHLPKTSFSNLYGPTEASVISTFYIVNREFKKREPLPIGNACENTETLIVDKKNNLIKQNGKIGELLIRGSGLAIGYWNNSEMTKKKFVQNPLHNHFKDTVYKTGDLVFYNELKEIVYVGRKDSQIKHSGYRIELSEIENATYEINEIEKSCVEYSSEKKQITLFYVSKGIREIMIRKKLSKQIPKYMIPTNYIRLKAIPLNKNGKIDREKLKKMI